MKKSRNGIASPPGYGYPGSPNAALARDRNRFSTLLGMCCLVAVWLACIPSGLRAQVEWKDRYVSIHAGDQVNPVTAKPSKPEYTVIVWEDIRGASVDIYAQMIDNANGLPQWQPWDGVPVCTVEGTQIHPVASYDSSGGVIIAWLDYRSRVGAPLVDSTAGEVYAHRLFLANGQLDANWSASSDGVPVCTGTNAICSELVIASTTDGAFLAWTDYRNSSGYPNYNNRDVYAQYLLSATGSFPANTSWTTNGIRVSIQDSLDQQHPAIVPDFTRRTGSDKYGMIVAYQDNRTDVWQIFTDNLNADGGNEWQQDVRVAPTEFEQINPVIGSTGSFTGAPLYGNILSWMDARNDGDGPYDVYAQRIDEYGTLYWPSSPFSGIPVCTAVGNQRAIRMAVSPARAALVWEDRRDSIMLATDVYGNVLDAQTGQTVYGTNTGAVLAAREDEQQHPCVDFSAYWIVFGWEDWRSGQGDIYAQEMPIALPSSMRWPLHGTVVTKAKEAQTGPDINGDVLVWQDERRDPVGNDQADDANVYAERIGDECDFPTEMHFKDMYVKHTAGMPAQGHRFIVDAEGSRFIVWQEERPQEGVLLGVYIQKIDSSGVPRWANNGVLLSDPAVQADLPDVCTDMQGGAFVTWRQNGQEIHLVRLDHDAQVIAQTLVSPSGDEPRIVEDDQGGVIIGYIQSTRLISERYYSTLLSAAGPVYVTISPPGYGLKAHKDYQYGVWYCFIEGGVNVAAHWNTAGSIRKTSFASTGAIGEFDITVDPIPNQNFNKQPQDCPYDLLFIGIYRAIQTPALDAWVFRIAYTNSVIQKINPFDRNVSNLQSPAQYASNPSIVYDSIPYPNMYGQMMGGALVAWADAYIDPADGLLKHEVRSQRVMYTHNNSPLNPVSLANGASALLDQGIRFDPETDIATVFNRSIMPSRYGITVWESDRQLGCSTGTKAIHAQYVDYSIAGNPRLWSGFGENVSPQLAASEQVLPIILNQWPGTPKSALPVLWSDARSGTPCLVLSSAYDAGGFIDWEKKSVRTHADVPRSCTVESLYPQPLRGGEPVTVRLSAARNTDVVLTVSDVLGRVCHTESRSIPGGSTDLTLKTGFRPGLYILRFGIDRESMAIPFVVIR